MELRTLEYFVAVAEERSFTRAAARCHVVQPAISQQIQALEKELGEPLFTRLPRQVVLTSGGAALLPHARACLAAAAAAALEFANRSGLLSGTLALGTVGGLESTCVPRLLGEYHRRYPGVGVRLSGASSPALLAQARSGEIDAAVIAEPPGGLPDGFDSRLLLEDRFVAVLPAGSRAPDHPMTLTEAARRPLIGYGSGTGAHAFVRDAFAAQGLRLDIAYATADVALQVALVAEGIGIALTSYANPLLRLDERIVVVPLEPAIRLRKVLAWRLGKRPGPPLRAFLDLLTELPFRADPDDGTVRPSGAHAPPHARRAPQD
ncbi:LysR family transcriptional regulator [Streptomyces sp. NPDC094448]|uniref:LysR family transcriptional regulator n=1 Tax=Streptomyces sp. NPDC094448 TaxID=3366063 RepID=UPI00381DC7A0